MRIIITGGSGLVGRALTQNLAADKHEIIIVSRSPEWVVGLPEAARAVRWDAKTAEGWADYVNGADAIIHLAGENIGGDIPFGVRWTDKRKKKILDSRLNSGAAVVEAIKEVAQKPKVLIQASAIGYYGPRGDNALTEDALPGNDFQADVCQKWEASTKEAESFGVRRVMIRTGLVLTMKGGILPWMVLPHRFFVGGRLGSGDQYISWIHIDDEVSAIRYLLENEAAEGPYNLTAPEPIANNEFEKEIGRALGRPAFFPAPGIAFKLAWGEASTLLLDGQKVIPEKLMSADSFSYQYPTAEEALTNLLASE